MARNIDQRLRKLEALNPARIILEMTVDGETKRMTARQFVEAGYDFLSAMHKKEWQHIPP